MPLKRGSGEPILVRDGVDFPMEDTKTGRRVVCRVCKYELATWFEDNEEFGNYSGSTFIERSFPGHMQIFLMFRERAESLAEP